MDVSIIISNWNGRKLLEKNIPFVLKASDKYHNGEVEIIVADDNSSDDSISFLNEKYPEIIITPNEKHNGYIENTNRGVKSAKGDILILLNSDVSPDEYFIEPLTTHFSDEKVFAVGCLEKSLQNGKEVLSGKSIGYFERGLVWHDRAPDQLTFGKTFWVAGGNGAFRKSVWENLGGFDNLYEPFYWEDIDLSYRAQKAGYKVLFEPKSIVFHNHESTIGAYYSKKEIDIISAKNQLLFIWKNITDEKLLTSHLIWMPIHLIRSTITPPSYFLKGFFRAFKQIGKIFSIRSTNKNLRLKKDKEILNIYS